jgi:hypothetical protein
LGKGFRDKDGERCFISGAEGVRGHFPSSLPLLETKGAFRVAEGHVGDRGVFARASGDYAA